MTTDAPIAAATVSARHKLSRITAVATAIGLMAGACGEGGEGATSPTSAAPAATGQPTTTTPSTTDATTTDATTTDATTTDATTTDATTTVPAPEPVAFDLTAVPALLAGLDADSADPLVIARGLAGFPYEVPVPDGSTLARFDVVVRADADVRRHEFSYDVVAPGGTVPDIDITLDGNGPGSEQIVEIWDPIMAELGFERANSTGSDPGDPGGPNSVNHVYVPTATAPTMVNGAPATPGNVFVWSSEDIAGAASGLDPSEPVGGYRIDADAEVPATEPLAVPLLAAIAEHVPLPDGAELQRATLRLESRSPDAFEIDRGARYVSISFEWSASPTATVDDLAAFYADPSRFDGDTLIAAEASFFDEGFYEPAELGPYGDEDRRLPLLLLRRYEGTLWIEAPSDPAAQIAISYDVALNPNDAELSPPAG